MTIARTSDLTMKPGAHATAATASGTSSASLRVDGEIAEIALNGGPPDLVDKALLRSLNAALDEAGAAADIRCLILHGGNARAFCAGSDIRAWGLVNRVVEEGSALVGARELARLIASRGPVSNRLAKKLVDAAQDQALDAVLSQSTLAQQEIFDSDDLHEGVAAFFAKRSPVFKGR